MGDFLNGAILMAYATAGLFFLRFWQVSGDRLFSMFAAAFFVLALNRLMVPIGVGVNESLPIYYIVRLIAYLMILLAILDKNYSRKH